MLWELGRDDPDLLGAAARLSRAAARSELGLVLIRATRMLARDTKARPKTDAKARMLAGSPWMARSDHP